MNVSRLISEHLIDRIYEAGLIPSLWPALLGELGAAVGGNGGFLFGVRDGYTSAVNSVEYDQLMPVFLGEGWSERDPLLPRAIALNHAGFVTDHDLLSEEEIATNEVYGNFYRKHGIGYRAGTLIPMPIGDLVAIVAAAASGSRSGAARGRRLAGRAAAASGAGVARSKPPGFERAVRRSTHLQALGLPGAVLRGPGRVFAVERPVRCAGAFAVSGSRPARDDRGRRGGRAARRSAQHAAAGRQPDREIHTGRRDGRVRCRWCCTSSRYAVPHAISSPRPRALLVVTPVDRAAVPTAEVLQGLFDLTPAEARVARGIGQAETIDTLADATGVNRETVRSQLKAGAVQDRPVAPAGTGQPARRQGVPRRLAGSGGCGRLSRPHYAGGITLPQEYGAKTKGRRKPAFLLLSFIAAMRGPALFIFPSE